MHVRHVALLSKSFEQLFLEQFELDRKRGDTEHARERGEIRREHKVHRSDLRRRAEGEERREGGREKGKEGGRQGGRRKEEEDCSPDIDDGNNGGSKELDGSHLAPKCVVRQLRGRAGKRKKGGRKGGRKVRISNVARLHSE